MLFATTGMGVDGNKTEQLRTDALGTAAVSFSCACQTASADLGN